ncbi:MAG: DUF4231 domain-containing protein [Cyanobacteria bacterium Co-bin13]|nr:DUF4231 domain-containing protein [Cyanobacteria bacterium Co-bin13]
MAPNSAYVDFLREDFDKLFAAMDLSDVQRHFLRARWLDQVIWMEKKAGKCRDWHYRLRLTAIILGVIVPILVGMNLGTDRANENKQYAVIVLSGLVAVSAAVEEFFHYGERWNNYRRTVESLKAEGWKFSQLSPPYSFRSHAEAFPTFAVQVEQLIQQDVQTYVTQITQPDGEKSVSDLLRQDLQDYLTQGTGPVAAQAPPSTQPQAATLPYPAPSSANGPALTAPNLEEALPGTDKVIHLPTEAVSAGEQDHTQEA